MGRPVGLGWPDGWGKNYKLLLLLLVGGHGESERRAKKADGVLLREIIYWSSWKKHARNIADLEKGAPKVLGHRRGMVEKTMNILKLTGRKRPLWCLNEMEAKWLASNRWMEGEGVIICGRGFSRVGGGLWMGVAWEVGGATDTPRGRGRGKKVSTVGVAASGGGGALPR